MSLLISQTLNASPSLQITFSYKPVICQARDKVWPDMQPVWSDITFVFLKWKYIFLFRVITEEPSQHVRSDSVFASQNPQICRTNVRRLALICRLASLIDPCIMREACVTLPRSTIKIIVTLLGNFFFLLCTVNQSKYFWRNDIFIILSSFSFSCSIY